MSSGFTLLPPHRDINMPSQCIRDLPGYIKRAVKFTMRYNKVICYRGQDISWNWDCNWSEKEFEFHECKTELVKSKKCIVFNFEEEDDEFDTKKTGQQFKLSRKMRRTISRNHLNEDVTDIEFIEAIYRKALNIHSQRGSQWQGEIRDGEIGNGTLSVLARSSPFSQLMELDVTLKGNRNIELLKYNKIELSAPFSIDPWSTSPLDEVRINVGVSGKRVIFSISPDQRWKYEKVYNGIKPRAVYFCF